MSSVEWNGLFFVSNRINTLKKNWNTVGKYVENFKKASLELSNNCVHSESLAGIKNNFYSRRIRTRLNHLNRSAYLHFY